MTIKMIKLPYVKKVTSLSRSSIYSLAKRGLFPKPVLLSARAVSWREDEVQAWLDEKTQARENANV